MVEGSEQDKPEQPDPKEGSDAQSPEELPAPPDPERLDKIEFAVKQLWTKAPLVVTIAKGPVESTYAPAELMGKLAERIAVLVRDVAGSQTMLYAIAPGNSMSMFFGDPEPTGQQEQFAYEVTFGAAQRVAELVETDGDSFFAHALSVGAPMRRYDELAQLVQSEGVTLKWKPRGESARQLTPDRAGRQHVRLQEPGEMSEWDTLLNGILYRIIAEPGAEEGTAGIHLFKWSGKPQGAHGAKVIAPADNEILHSALAANLFGQPVEAKLRIRRPKPGLSVDPEYVERRWIAIEPGPGEESGLGVSIHDLLDEGDQ